MKKIIDAAGAAVGDAARKGEDVTLAGLRSSLSGLVSRQAVTVRLEIYRLEDDPKWVLEVVNERGTSIVWNDLFDAEGAAYDAFEAAVAQDGMHTFLDETDVVPPATRH